MADPNFKEKKKLIFLVVCGILIVIGTGYWLYWYRVPMIISAGDIVDTSISPTQGKISGSFTVTSVPLWPGNEDAIRSHGTGGACLVAEWGKFNLPPPILPPGQTRCTENSQCTSALPQDKKDKKWHGYCDTDGKDGDDGQCWVRPGPPTSEELCNKSPFYTPPKIWANGTYPATKQDYIVPKFPGGIKWRVVACLMRINPATGEDDPSLGCGMEVFGTPNNVDYGPIPE